MVGGIDLGAGVGAGVGCGVGSAVGSILGLTLAPKKGAETRRAIKHNTMKVFLRSKKALRENKNIGFAKKIVIKWLTNNK